MLSRYSLVTNDLTLPAKISALVTLGKVIKPFFNSSNALLLVDADHFPDGTLPTIKVGCFNINTLFSIGVIRVSLPYYSSAKTLV
jgi:hypothetical protein